MAATGTATTIIRGGPGPILIITALTIITGGTSNALPIIITIIPAEHAGITATTREVPVRGGGIRRTIPARRLGLAQHRRPGRAGRGRRKCPEQDLRHPH
jgi:hypothetical protein